MTQDTNETATLELRDISRRFGSRNVVDGLSLRLHAGQVTCLLGPSGCGKSTTLRIAAGVDQQTTGHVLINGELVSGDGQHLPPESRGIGLMFQDFALFPHLTVAKNVGFGIARDPNRDVRVRELLGKVGLEDFGDKFPHQLSGGEQQRVALARALAPRPAVMLMDEPFSGLDNRLRDTVRDATLELLKSEGTAVLMVTHEPEEAMRMADQIALMRDGRIVQSGAPYNIYNSPVDRRAAAFFSDINVINGQVHGALTRTPFGDFLTPGIADGKDVEIVIRPQHLRIDFDRGGRGPNPTVEEGTPARGVVERARFLGHQSLVEFAMDYDNVRLHAVVPGVFLPNAGTPLWLSVRRDRCFVFVQ
ncbi:Fe3+/spermidine/putrescine ABC transporter ATP-binding protein [Amylibacter kogurei]|uniref:Fe3+/spermidine/putrescine ABC transporter ATP-binding protein n=1 Tax=Paramylibacter kogurei TaxID=1889778 RepID=A0A2G5K5P9_9RHOB|nr:ABC transporter ATP-binding protein [Amylibacter kogurei]PIB24343.1 Fe3+/spermidine/putrescine ABC transporter ATP-binding protein [Amylibacter kogurei]